MKLKKKWMRLISCILVVAMILQLTLVQNVSVSAAYTDDEVYKLLEEALKGAAEEDKEEIEETIRDYYSAKNQKAGDWYRACKNPKGDLLPCRKHMIS